MIRSAADWYRILVACQVRPTVAVAWSSIFAEAIRPGTFNLGDVEVDDFLGQILHESAGLTRLEEALNYRAERLCQVWPRRFPTLADARPYANNPEALANRVYGGRMGNTEPGDGWRYRGRTPLQITGKNNYQRVGELMGLDLVKNPGLLSQPLYALKACIAWWEENIPDELIGDVEKVSRRVNGGLIGLAQREELSELAHEAVA